MISLDGVLTGWEEGPVGGITDSAEAGVRKVFAQIIFIWFFFASQVNFVLFIGIIVILVQKLQSPDMGGNESSIYL